LADAHETMDSFAWSYKADPWVPYAASPPRSSRNLHSKRSAAPALESLLGDRSSRAFCWPRSCHCRPCACARRRCRARTSGCSVCPTRKSARGGTTASRGSGAYSETDKAAGT